ncbi:2-C-methyl-D-erythritol 4-phosphate cytidylyltransferase [Abditibacteriota bacterium]|nr:2-C-methyl-D-erythritol 4-phosphate cytidylyltransferase [Abditibacteriota bacterium]
MVTITAIVPAAGCGARAGLNGNKILAPVLERPILTWTLEALLNAPWSDANAELVELVVVARADEFALVRLAAPPIPEGVEFLVIEGGDTRQDSVEAGLEASNGAYVLIHDAARPCLSGQLIARCVARGIRAGAAIAALPASDTVKWAQEKKADEIKSTLPRERVHLAQTPQVFWRGTLLKAFKKARETGFNGTDCSSLVENAGGRVALVEGERTNFKVTFPDDLGRAEAVLARGLS